MAIDDIPTVNWPKDNFYGKFVQLYLKGRPILRFSRSIERDGHSLILREILDLAGIEGYKTTVGILSKAQIPSPFGEQYSVVGMGDSKLIGEGVIGFLGESGDYGYGPNLEHLIEISRQERGYLFICYGKKIEDGAVIGGDH